MPPHGRGASASRRVTRVDSESGSENDYDYTKHPHLQKQQEIMMNDLGSATRNFITTNERGGKTFRVPAHALQRDCNQKGSTAARLAGENKNQINAWSEYFKTDDAKAAGGEDLEDLNGGNTHRLRVRTELQESGVTNLQDTYIDPRFRKGGFSNRGGRGATAAVANDRGHYSHARGGGFAGRGKGRGGVRGSGLVSRPLDPAVDPERFYNYKQSVPKKRSAQVNMSQGKVTMKPPSEPAQMAQPSSSPSVRPPRRHQSAKPFVDPRIDQTEDFMALVLSQFKTRADSGEIITPPKTECPIDGSSVLPNPPAPSAVPAVPSVAAPTEEVKSTVTVHHIDRNELEPNAKSPDAYTDGQLTQSNLSGFSPSISSQDEPAPASTSTAGLGIDGLNTEQTADLMSVEIAGNKNASLVQPLQVSPKVHSFSRDEEYTEYLQLKEFIKNGHSQDFEEWASQRKAKSDEGKEHSPELHRDRSAPVSITAGYKIGSDSLGTIIGDDRNVAAQAKSTQTTPSLMQSKWASPELSTLFAFKANFSPLEQSKPSSINPVPDRQESTAEPPHAAQIPSTTQISQEVSATPTGAANATATTVVDYGPVAPGEVRAPGALRNGINGTGYSIVEQNGGSLSYLQSTEPTKPANPFAPREDPDIDFSQLNSAREQLQTVETQATASPNVQKLNSTISGQSFQPTNVRAKASAFKGLGDSKWAVASAEDAPTVLHSGHKTVPLEFGHAPQSVDLRAGSSASAGTAGINSAAPVAQDVPAVTKPDKQLHDTSKSGRASKAISDTKMSENTGMDAVVANDISEQIPQPRKPTVAKFAFVEHVQATQNLVDADTAKTALKESHEIPKRAPSKQGLLASKWSGKPASAADNPDDRSGTSKCQRAKIGPVCGDLHVSQRTPPGILESIQTNVSKVLSNSAATGRVLEGSGKQTVRPAMTSQKPAQRNPFMNLGRVAPTSPYNDVPSMTPTTNILGDSKNIRNSAAKNANDRTSWAAVALHKQFSNVLRAGADRDHGRLTKKENINKQHGLGAEAIEELEEGEIVENGDDAVTSLTSRFDAMDLSHSKKR